MATNRRDIELSPRFLVPPAVIDIRQDNDEDSYAVYTGAEGDIVTPNENAGPVLDYPESSIPQAPSTYRIVEQTVRISADGSTVVDVLLEFPDNLGVYDIDVRVTPA